MKMKPVHTIAIAASIAFASTAFIAKSALTAPSAPQTRVETDQKTGAILFIVDGKEEARITPDGLRVRKGITYGNTLTDNGAGSYDRAVRATHAD